MIHMIQGTVHFMEANWASSKGGLVDGNSLG